MRGRRQIKALVFFAVICAFAALFAFDVFSYFRFEFLREQLLIKGGLAAFYEKSPFLTLFVFFLVYALAAGLSIPGAASVLTLAGGFLFGPFIGAAVSSFASSTGASLAFLLSRLFFRDLTGRLLRSRRKAFESRFQKEGGWYLLSLRLIPAVPFFAVNLLMGLTPMRLHRFFLISQIGMLPATVVYALAGAQLAKIKSLKDVASPALILCLLALALLPWALKLAMSFAPSLAAFRFGKRHADRAKSV